MSASTQPLPPPEDIASASTNSVITRLHNRLRAELETNRRLRFENLQLRQENARLRQRMRKSALS
jgi:hypothetical protein